MQKRRFFTPFGLISAFFVVMFMNGIMGDRTIEASTERFIQEELTFEVVDTEMIAIDDQGYAVILGTKEFALLELQNSYAGWKWTGYGIQDEMGETYTTSVDHTTGEVFLSGALPEHQFGHVEKVLVAGGEAEVVPLSNGYTIWLQTLQDQEATSWEIEYVDDKGVVIESFLQY
ncbi:hypothetical protein [Alkalicoccus luteus]|uniref:hypothetical protein n=1 Tax=Alkalicoccus luteus TaxID=1237094 RepID=UPI00403418E6